MRVTLLASDLGPTLGGTFAAALATHLPPRFEVTLLALAASPSTATAHLARSGVGYRVLPVRHPFDLPGVLALRRAVTESRPNVLHLCGRRARWLAPVLPLPFQWRTDHGTGSFILAGPAVLPAPDGPAPDLAAFGVPPGSRVVLAAGGFDRNANLRSAVWAFDVLKYTAPDWRLVLVGDGPLRGECERFARQLGGDDLRVHFLGRRDNLPALIRSAQVVWDTHRAGGRTTAAEAAAAGVPVLAAYAGPVALAAATFNLSPDTARIAAARIAAARFSAATVAERVAAAYDAFPAASPPAGR